MYVEMALNGRDDRTRFTRPMVANVWCCPGFSTDCAVVTSTSQYVTCVRKTTCSQFVSCIVPDSTTKCCDRDPLCFSKSPSDYCDEWNDNESECKAQRGLFARGGAKDECSYNVGSECVFLRLTTWYITRAHFSQRE
jgi:hypothetical protein